MTNVGTISRAKYRAKALRMVKRYDDIHSMYEWRGGGNPEHVPGIEEEYAAARAKLVNRLTELLINEALT